MAHKILGLREGEVRELKIGSTFRPSSSSSSSSSNRTNGPSTSSNGYSRFNGNSSSKSTNNKFNNSPSSSSRSTNGHSSSDNPNCDSFHTIRYDFKPVSIDTTKPGTIEFGQGTNNADNVTVTVPNVEGHSSQSETVFSGSSRPYLKECVLIIDHETGEITLERLSRNIIVKNKRIEGGSRSGASGVVGASSSSQNGSATLKQPNSVGSASSTGSGSNKSSPKNVSSPPSSSSQNVAKQPRPTSGTSSPLSMPNYSSPSSSHAAMTNHHRPTTSSRLSESSSSDDDDVDHHRPTTTIPRKLTTTTISSTTTIPTLRINGKSEDFDDDEEADMLSPMDTSNRPNGNGNGHNEIVKNELTSSSSSSDGSSSSDSSSSSSDSSDDEDDMDVDDGTNGPSSRPPLTNGHHHKRETGSSSDSSDDDEDNEDRSTVTFAQTQTKINGGTHSTGTVVGVGDVVTDSSVATSLTQLNEDLCLSESASDSE